MTDHPNRSAGTEDKEKGKQIGAYLGMSGIDAEDVVYIRNIISAPAQPVVAWRMAPGDGILHGITEDSKIADLWRKSGCVIEPLTLAAQPSPAATVETKVWSMEEALSDAGAAKVNAVLAESHTGLSAATGEVRGQAHRDAISPSGGTSYNSSAVTAGAAIRNYLKLWDSCGGSTAVAASSFADARQMMRDAIANEPQAVQVSADSERQYSRVELEDILANRWPSVFCEEGRPGAPNQFAKNLVAFFSSHPRAVMQEVVIPRRSEADVFYKILQTIARFPITDPKNMDAVNMRLIAEGALALSRPVLCTCSPLTNYTDSPHEASCPLASHQLGTENER